MSCCEPTIFPFVFVSTTTIAYSPALMILYGAKPNVQVYYKFTGGTQYVLSDDMNQVSFDGVNITVDHGGTGQIGFIVIR